MRRSLLIVSGMVSTQLVAARRADEGQGDAGVAAGRLQDDRVRLDLAGLLGGVDHGHADPVLDAVGRVVELQLGDHVRPGALRQAAQAHQRGVADQLGDVVGDAHWTTSISRRRVCTRSTAEEKPLICLLGLAKTQSLSSSREFWLGSICAARAAAGRYSRVGIGTLGVPCGWGASRGSRQKIREGCYVHTRRRLTSPAWSVPTLRVLLFGKAPLSGAGYRCTACCPPFPISRAAGPLSTNRRPFRRFGTPVSETRWVRSPARSCG